MIRAVSDYEAAVRKKLTEERFEHSCAVRDCAVELAEKYGCSCEEAEIAGLLHDYARDMPQEELLRIGEEKGLIKNEIERLVPVLLHGPVGALLVKEELEISNSQILEAIALHTLGAPAMGLLARIIYISDLIAAGRDFEGVEYLRDLAQRDIDEALLACFSASLEYCLKSGKLIHPQTVEAWNYYVKSVKRVNMNVRGGKLDLIEGRDVAICAARAAVDKKAIDVQILDLQGIFPVADYFVICSGRNVPHISAIADEIQSELEKQGFKLARLQGTPESGWVLLDCGDVIVHVFSESAREFYNLERLWRDARVVPFEEII